MQYLQVVVSNTGAAISANNQSLAQPPGCLAFMLGDRQYPISNDYFNYLTSEGWTIVTTGPTGLAGLVYTFEGGRNYQIEWKGDYWEGKRDDYNNYEDDYYYSEDYYEDDWSRWEQIDR